MLFTSIHEKEMRYIRHVFLNKLFFLFLKEYIIFSLMYVNSINTSYQLYINSRPCNRLYIRCSWLFVNLFVHEKNNFAWLMVAMKKCKWTDYTISIYRCSRLNYSWWDITNYKLMIFELSSTHIFTYSIRVQLH